MGGTKGYNPGIKTGNLCGVDVCVGNNVWMCCPAFILSLSKDDVWCGCGEGGCEVTSGKGFAAAAGGGEPQN